VERVVLLSKKRGRSYQKLTSADDVAFVASVRDGWRIRRTHYERQPRGKAGKNSGVGGVYYVFMFVFEKKGGGQSDRW
jgi:hypothetical protein